MSFATVLFRIATVAAIFILIDLYVFQGLKSAWRNVSYKQYLYMGYWLVSLGIIFLIFAAFILLPRNQGPTNSWVKILAGAFILLAIPKLVFTIFLLTEDIARMGIASWRYFSEMFNHQQASNTWHIPGRRKFISQVGLLVAAIPFGAVLHGIVAGRYNFKIKDIMLHFKNLPKAFDGFVITQLSDFHIGSFGNRSEVIKGVNMARNIGGDVILFTGDLVNNMAVEAEPWIDVLKTLKAPSGVYSTFGNHDYGDYVEWDSQEQKANNLKRLAEIHKESGMDLLCNEHRIIERDGQQIAIVGIENWGLPPFPQYGDLNKALAHLDPTLFKVLLSHDPSHWDHEAKKHPANIDLALAGHTHGMQFGIEIPGFKWSPVKFKYPKWAGLYQEGEKYLYVNRGFGFLGFPGRVGIWPEITKITLKCA